MQCLQCGKEILNNAKICLSCAEIAIKSCQSPEAKYKITTIGKRASALTVESLLWMFLTFLAIYLILKINLKGGHSSLTEQLVPLVISPDKTLITKIVLQLLISVNLLAIIYTGLMFHYFGTTIGKICLGITIINQKTGQKLNWLEGILRDWVYKSGLNLIATIATFYASASIASLLSVMVFIITLVQYLLPFIDKEKKALHDYLSGTIVVE